MPTTTAPASQPLAPEAILDAAEEVLRRYGPAKASVVDVARTLGLERISPPFPRSAPACSTIPARSTRRAS